MEPTFKRGDRVKVLQHSISHEGNPSRMQGSTFKIDKIEKRDLEYDQYDHPGDYPDGYIYFAPKQMDRLTYGYPSNYLQRINYCICYPWNDWDDALCFDCVDKVCP